MSSNLSGPLPAPGALKRLLGNIFNEQRIANVQLLADGLCNFNYKVEFDSGAEPVVLRIYGRDPAACPKEAALLRHVRATLPVPEVLHVETHGRCGVGPFLITRYVAGITFRQLRSTREPLAIAQAAYAIGETLAAFGRYKFARAGALGAGLAVVDDELHGVPTIPELIDAYLAAPQLRVMLAANVRARLHALVWSRAADLARLQTETCLVHRDFNNRNVLVRPERGRWRVAAIVDWEYAAAGSPMFDIASFLQYEQRRSPAREPHFSAGYEHGGGRLPPDWWQLARIVNLLSQCATLTERGVPAAIKTEVADLVRATAAETQV
ncbi:MAG TPA: phosphotransferase [Pyrinomonadaceae bacterium]